jgi:hypothetical protein
MWIGHCCKEVSMRASLSISILALALLTTAAFATENLLQDGNFATGPAPTWANTPLFSATLDTGNGTPAPSLHVQPINLPSFVYQCVSIQEGTLYQISGNLELTSLSGSAPSSGIGYLVGFFNNCSLSNINLNSSFTAATLDVDQMTIGVWYSVHTRAIQAPSGTSIAFVAVGTTDTSETFAFNADSASFELDDVIFEDKFENE